MNQIRPRIKAWREADYPGATGITKRLLQHWRDPEQRDSNRRFFFCQLEAIETLIWLTEAPASERVGIEIPSDGGPFPRLCCKMATGSGKTIVMAMLIAWQVLNKVTYPQDKRFSKNFLLIAPGLTVKNRLQVLVPGSSGNYYTEFQDHPAGSGRQTPPGPDLPGADSQLAQAGLGDRRADSQEAQRGQARRKERRGLRPRGAGRDGFGAEHARHQRRSPPRLARAAEGQALRECPKTN